MSSPSPRSGASSPEELRQLAAVCRSVAAGAVDGHARLLACIASARWEGPAADRCRTATQHDRVVVDSIVQLLVGIERDLTAHAAFIEHRAAELASIERRVRAWIAGHPPIIGNPGPDAAMIGELPPTGSDDWEQIERQLRALGQAL